MTRLATTRRQPWPWPWLLIASLLLCIASCRRTGTAVPAEVEVEWPDAAPYELGPLPAQAPRAEPPGGKNNAEKAAPPAPPQPSGMQPGMGQ